ncbi:MAG: ribonuclease D [Gammaproteobacteria bacterium]|nr:ribonuclease D [Gammaproteobacteria bacterium]
MRTMTIVSKQATGMTADALIGDESTLRTLVGTWPPGAGIALDTEFVRERTYYPRLCLVQVSVADSLALIDPLAIADARVFIGPLMDPGRPKLLHAARQDVEALLPLTGTPLAPVFDTQLAAALLGFAAQIGYAELVRLVLGVELAKGHARTDWARRPLSPAQLAYAADDVRYLPALAALLDERLTAAGRRGWMEEESAALTNIRLYRVAPAEAWRRLKGLERLQPDVRHAIRALARWREERAMECDLPRGWVLPDAALYEIAQARPRTREDLLRIASVPRAAADRVGGEILKALSDESGVTDDLIADDWLRAGPEQLRLLKSLQQRLLTIAGELEIQPEVLATRRDLTALLRGERELPILSGWRRTIIGEPLLAAL